MHSLKATCAGQIFALAKPHDSVGKKSRNRIPKEERKALVESFIKKHQNLNNGSFPSLSLTHREVGGSFYTIREIVREIIQENRVLGPAGDLILNGKASDNLQDQSPSGSILMDPVAPLSLPPDGYHFASDQNHTILENLISVPSNFSFEAEDSNSLEKNINGSQTDLKDKVSDILDCKELNETQLGSADISRTQFAAYHGEENDTKHDAGLQNRVQTTCTSFATKPVDKELDADNKDGVFVEVPSTVSTALKPVEDDERVNDAGETIMDMPSTMNSPDVQPSNAHSFCEDGKGNETSVETDTIDSVDLREISSSIPAVSEEKETEVIDGQHKVTMAMEMHITKNTLCSNDMPSTMNSQDVHFSELNSVCEAGKGNETNVETDTMDSVDRREISSATSALPVEKGTDVVAVQQNAAMEKGNLDDLDSFSSQKGSSATLDRIKPKSWDGVGAREANPFLAVLKSFLTAFVKFWSE